MWKYRHTAIVIFALALPCFGQFTEIWTNGNLFAVNEMASQCYSASVERCKAVGVTPNEPSFFDYLLGKNHAKLVSVKANIESCVVYSVLKHDFYIKPESDAYAALTNGGLAAFQWSNKTDFLSWAGLPTNSLDETPYFKSQYPSTTGGWHSVRAMLTNIVCSSFQSSEEVADPGAWINSLAQGYVSSSYSWETSYSSTYNIATNWAFADPISFYAYPFCYAEVAVNTSTQYTSAAYSSYNLVGFYGLPTNIGHSADVYIIAIPPPLDGFHNFFEPSWLGGYPTNYNAEFNLQGQSAGLISTNWLLATNFAESFFDQQSVKIGDYSDTSNAPPMVSFPSSPSVGYVAVKGWAIKENMTMVWWNGTNGFKYK